MCSRDCHCGGETKVSTKEPAKNALAVPWEQTFFVQDCCPSEKIYRAGISGAASAVSIPWHRHAVPIQAAGDFPHREIAAERSVPRMAPRPGACWTLSRMTDSGHHSRSCAYNGTGRSFPVTGQRLGESHSGIQVPEVLNERNASARDRPTLTSSGTCAINGSIPPAYSCRSQASMINRAATCTGAVGKIHSGRCATKNRYPHESRPG